MKILVPGNHLMVGLLGQRDELLRLIEAEFEVQILVRGNEINITGTGVEVERVGRLFEEMVVLLEQGHDLDRDNLGRSIEMMKADQRPTDVLTTEVVRGRKTVRPKTAGQKRYVDAVRDNTVTFAIGPAGTGKSYLAVALAVQALQAKEVNRIILTRPAVEAGERLGFLPGDMLQKVDPYLRPLYDALYDMVEPEVVVRLMERGTIEVAPLAYMRGRTLNDSFIILDEAQNTTRGTDEDVPHAAGLRLEGRGDRRRDADRPAGRARSFRAHAGAAGARRYRRSRVRRAQLARRRAPPHRAGHRRRVRTQPEVTGRARVDQWKSA